MENEIKNEVKASDTKKNKNDLMVSDINELAFSNKSDRKIFTTIDDPKMLFNLESVTDYKINDCKGETIKVKDFMIKVIEKELENPIVNEETGEVEQTKEYKKITILIDDEGKSYVTASKMFANQFIKAIQYFGEDRIKNEGLLIKIIDRPIKDSSNKALGFELV